MKASLAYRSYTGTYKYWTLQLLVAFYVGPCECYRHIKYSTARGVAFGNLDLKWLVKR